MTEQSGVLGHVIDMLDLGRMKYFKEKLPEMSSEMKKFQH